MICLIYSQSSASSADVAPRSYVRLGDVVVVGRQFDCDLCVEDDHMSRRHFMVDATEQGFRVRDLGSMNGTLLNGVPVTIAPLCSGDRLRAGNSYFVVEMRPESVADNPGVNRPDPYRQTHDQPTHYDSAPHYTGRADERPPAPPASAAEYVDPHQWVSVPFGKPIDRFNPMQRLEIADHPSANEPTVRLDPRELGRQPAAGPPRPPAAQPPAGRYPATPQSPGRPVVGPPAQVPPRPNHGGSLENRVARQEATAPRASGQQPREVANAYSRPVPEPPAAVPPSASSASPPAQPQFEMSGLRQVMAKVPDGLEDFQVTRLRDLVAGCAFLLVDGQQRAKELCGLLGEHYRTGLVINRSQLDQQTAELLEYLTSRGAAQALSETIYWAEFNPVDDMLAQLCRQATGLDAAVCLGFRKNDPPAAETIAELCHLLCYPSLLLDALTRYGSEDAVLLFRKIVFLIFEKNYSSDLYLFTEPGFQTHGTWVEGTLSVESV